MRGAGADAEGAVAEAPEREPYEALVIGGSQAGLAIGYYLLHLGLRFAIVEAAPEIGHAWRCRWDSLKLFTPSQYDGLPGMPFPAPPGVYPGKDEVADYLRTYAERLRLPVELATRVEALERTGHVYVAQTSRGTYKADNVVVATGPFQVPYAPPLSRAISPEVFQVHSSEYRNPGQLPRGDVLVVGGGASGVQIAEELSRSRRVYLSLGGRRFYAPQRILSKDLFWWATRTGGMKVAVDSPIMRARLGRWVIDKDPVIPAVSPRRLRRHGVTIVRRVRSAEGERLRLDGGRTLAVRSIVWATGFRLDLSWIKVPVLGADGRPVHRRGVAVEKGLYFVGLTWQWTRGSALLGWVKEDAAFIADRIADRTRPGRRA